MPPKTIPIIITIIIVIIIFFEYIHFISQSNASTGAGINDGIEWLCLNIGNRHK